MRGVLVVVIIFWISFLKGTGASAQNQRGDVPGSWMVLTVNSKITKHWSIPFVGILRHYDLFNTYEFAFTSTGIRYSTSNNLSFTLGTAILDAKSFAVETIPEYSSQLWVYQECTKTIPLTKGNLSHRLRLETRWLSRTPKINNRLRYRLQYTRPLNKISYVKGFNEVFFNAERQLFNQNRCFIGIGAVLSKHCKIELGYLKNHFKSNHYDRLRIALNIRPFLN